MADVSKIDIDGVQWDIKDAYLRNYTLPENGSLHNYIKNQNAIDATLNIQGGTSVATAITASHDGILTLSGTGSGTGEFRGVELHIKYKNESAWHTLRNGSTSSLGLTRYATLIVPIFKGDVFYAVASNTITEYYIRYYISRNVS